jgi:TP901 family phage tail tape measure protein
VAHGRQARTDLDHRQRPQCSRRAAADRGSGRAPEQDVGRFGKIAGGAFAVSTIARAGKAVLANGDAYTSQLNKIEALTTAQQRAQVGGITGVAKQLEANKGAYARYGNTVADAAGGVTELVKAGQTLPQALKSVNAALVLAKAGEMDVADAGGLIAVALKTWNLPAKRAGDIANYLANAANISTANVSDLAEALKFVAPVAAKTGVSAQQTAAYLAQLSNAGINGTVAGEGLRRMLESLQAPDRQGGRTLKDLGVNVFDAQGKVRPFSP